MVRWEPKKPQHEGHGESICLLCGEKQSCKCLNLTYEQPAYRRCDECIKRISEAQTFEELKSIVIDLCAAVEGLRKYTRTYKPLSERRF